MILEWRMTMLHTTEEKKRMFIELAKTVLYVAGFIALVTIMVVAVAARDARAGELEDGLADAVANDFLHVNGVCMKAFEELNKESALVYYQCMAGGYGAKADATIMRMKIEAAKSTSKEVKM